MWQDYNLFYLPTSLTRVTIHLPIFPISDPAVGDLSSTWKLCSHSTSYTIEYNKLERDFQISRQHLISQR